MLFRLAVRGIPNFSYLQYEEFEDMSKVFAKYFVKVRSIFTGLDMKRPKFSTRTERE